VWYYRSPRFDRGHDSTRREKPQPQATAQSERTRPVVGGEPVAGHLAGVHDVRQAGETRDTSSGMTRPIPSRRWSRAGGPEATRIPAPAPAGSDIPFERPADQVCTSIVPFFRHVPGRFHVKRRTTRTPLRRSYDPNSMVEKPLNTWGLIGAYRDPARTLIIGIEPTG
jgi:hypothetical protein